MNVIKFLPAYSDEKALCLSQIRANHSLLLCSNANCKGLQVNEFLKIPKPAVCFIISPNIETDAFGYGVCENCSLYYEESGYKIIWRFPDRFRVIVYDLDNTDLQPKLFSLLRYSNEIPERAVTVDKNLPGMIGNMQYFRLNCKVDSYHYWNKKK